MTPSVHSGRPHPCRRLATLALALALAVGCLPLAAAAAPSPGYRDTTPLPANVTKIGANANESIQSAGSGGGTALRMLLALGIVIAIIFGLYKLLRRAADRNDRGVRADGRMTVVATTALAHSRSLHLVRVGDELVLVGAAEQSVTPIRVYSAEESRRIVLEEPQGGMRSFGPGSGDSTGLLGGIATSLRKLTAR